MKIPDPQEEHGRGINRLTIHLDGLQYGMTLSPTTFRTTEEFADRLSEVVRNTILNHYYKLEDK